MTNSEAIKQLKERYDIGQKEYLNFAPKYIESLKMAMESLEETDKLKAEIEQYKSALITWSNSNKGMLKFNQELKDKIEQLKSDYSVLARQYNNVENSSIRYYNEVKQLKSELEQSVKLPCKVGDVVYDNDFGYPTPSTIVGYSFGEINQDYDIEDDIEQIYLYSRSNRYNIDMSFPVSCIGKSIFLTREEAEQSLKGKVEK